MSVAGSFNLLLFSTGRVAPKLDPSVVVCLRLDPPGRG